MRKFKTFNLRLILIIPSIFLVYFVSIYYFYYDNKNDSYSIELYAEHKEKYANSIVANKIVFTSGSSNFLGIRAYQIEEEFGIPTVNLSVHAGLRSKYILDRAKQSIKPGDIVIFPLEYTNAVYNGEPSITINRYLLTYDKAYFNTNYEPIDQLKMLSSISIMDLVNGLVQPKNDGKTELRATLMKNINKQGDMVNIKIHDSLKTKKNPFKLPNPIELETSGLKTVGEFNEYCKANDISFFVTYPNIIREGAYSNEKYQRYFGFLDSYFAEKGIDVIGNPEAGMYEKRLFFDSEYHLNDEGSNIRTKDFMGQMRSNTKVMAKIKAIRGQ